VTVVAIEPTEKGWLDLGGTLLGFTTMVDQSVSAMERLL
jgi:hypothetical protein